MITSLKFNNCFAFNEPVEMSLKADMRTKKFACNISNQENNTNILKSAVLYGSNNTGKTTFIRCVKAIKRTLLNQNIFLKSNAFTKKNNNICELSISFIYNKKEYIYEYKYNDKNKSYIYENMCEILKDKHGNEKIENIFLKDNINNKYKCSRDLRLQEILNIASTDNILIYTLQTDKFEILNEIKKILTSTAKNIEIVTMNHIPFEKTLEILKKKNQETKKIVDFVKNADLYLEDYRYEDNIVVEIEGENIPGEVLKDKSLMDQIKLISVYKGKAVSSMVFDSLGTKKIAAIASYIIEAIEQGKALFVDELDSSLHFKITRAIVSMFNNDINKNAQLIATLHDISLLDCKKMFRKEQIWFTAKDDEKTMLYSLKEFNYNDDGIRGDSSDIQDKYSKGIFGAIPDPDLISSLLEVGNEDN
jgi:AAA15 family ATPase/GTPase